MILTIIAMDSSWKKTYDLAKLLNHWVEIEVVNNSSPGMEFGIDTKEYSFLNDADMEKRELIIASLDPQVRESEFIKWKACGGAFATLIHPQNYIYPTTQIGEGSIAFAGVIVYPNCKIDDNVILAEYSSVSHDSYIGKNSILLEKVTIAGHGIVKNNVVIKPNSVIREHVEIDSNAVIECGSVVLRNVLHGQVVSGNPARNMRKEN